jgi:hypothetical protein
LSIQLRSEDNNPKKVFAAGQTQSCGEVIQNGDFEAGPVSWVEVTTEGIIRNDHPTPYLGSWVAWFGGVNAVERLTQLFHVPADVEDAQTLTFYIQVTSDDSDTQVYDTFDLRFLDAGGNPISSDFAIANNTTKTNWQYIPFDLGGMTQFAGQDIQIQFECNVNATYSTSFAVDLVSLNLACKLPPTPTPYYIYLPVVVRAPPPTSTPSPSAPAIAPAIAPVIIALVIAFSIAFTIVLSIAFIIAVTIGDKHGTLHYSNLQCRPR